MGTNNGTKSVIYTPTLQAGTAAGFGTPTATIDNNTGTPSVTVTASGPDTAKVFAFAFSNLKGATGSNGTTPTLAAAAGSNIGSVGTPSVTATTSNGTTTFTFNNLKGEPGTNATTTSVFSSSANGLAPAASNANKTTAESAQSNYYLCADGKYRQLPTTAF